MSNHLKKHGFSLGVPCLFTRGRNACELIHFREAEEGDEASPALACPDNWSAEAAEILAEAAASSIPIQTRAIEENTVPSWLWRHMADGKSAAREISAQQIFDRVVGSAAYAGWKQDLFATEAEARHFYEEARYALLQRFIALEPATLASLGLGWAYGTREKTAAAKPVKAAAAVDIPNTTVDAVVGGSLDKTARGKWQRILHTRKADQPLHVHFSDIAADWNTSPAQGAVTMLDLLALRHNDGSINIAALRHVVRLAVMLLDLHGHKDFSIGFANLAPLLAALAIAYDSDAARTVAGAIAAIVTAEAYATSAGLAALRGPGDDYAANREGIMRALRNHRRAAYGDRNDYEKISVLPAPLRLEKCPDLTLVAAAQRLWDEAIELVREHGLRTTQVTGTTSSPALALFMESASQGIAPMPSLTAPHSFQRKVAPHVNEALARLGYDRATAKSIGAHIAGALTLEKAPAVNHAALRACRFDAEALERIEDYLPQVNDIRLAFTPWVLGEDFCRKALRIPATKLRNPALNLLAHLGFNDAAVAAANAYCYGRGTAKDSRDLRPKHAAIFATAADISAEARIRMAAAVQSFVSGNVTLDLPLPAGTPVEKSEKLLLGAWRQGVKSLSLFLDEHAPAPAEKKSKATKAMTAFLHTQKPSLPARQSKPKAARRILGQTHGHAPAKTASTKGRGR